MQDYQYSKMARKKFAYTVIYLLILFHILVLIIIPVLFATNKEFGSQVQGVVHGYIVFYNAMIEWENMYLVLVMCSAIVIAIVVELILLIIQYNIHQIKLKKIIIIVSTCFTIVTIDFILEHPTLLGYDILFPKSIITKYEYASNEYNNSLAPEDKYEIYNLLIKFPSDVFIYDSLHNNAGFRGLWRQYSIPIDPDVQSIFREYWAKTNGKGKFISKYSLEDHGCRFVFSPIKKIGNKIIIGCAYTCAPLIGKGWYSEIEKVNNKWIIIKEHLLWVS